MQQSGSPIIQGPPPKGPTDSLTPEHELNVSHNNRELNYPSHPHFLMPTMRSEPVNEGWDTPMQIDIYCPEWFKGLYHLSIKHTTESN